ncbi:YlmH/Sll1252 family protein [Lactobacillus psittaci]|uniref:Photosystem II S4 domain-containing protein n=1 Tax=Lactobacillus psittaci DSM 15354 TaxID=1122152 RepID=A0A0R1S7G6_9LACO|nr:YlmH/Sll1252 family protein [Lactobacillus psittaci]KRL63476.1 photosystem II S4 domain-containing protein [Lactobacillus psittaci DSM 15354]
MEQAELLDKIQNRTKFLRNKFSESDVNYLSGELSQLIFKEEEILTPFLDPAQRQILKELAGNDFSLQEFGGYHDFEKARVIIRKDWQYQEVNSFEVALFEINYNQKFSQISHGQILGVLANSGIQLSAFGDIITDGQGRWQFFAKQELADFFQNEIFKIGSTHVKIKKLPINHVLPVVDEHEENSYIVSSLRLDAVVSALSRISRKQGQGKITDGEIKINWHEEHDFNIMVKMDDVISIRHLGRIKIINITTTRKGRYCLEVYLWQSKNHKIKRH